MKRTKLRKESKTPIANLRVCLICKIEFFQQQTRYFFGIKKYCSISCVAKGRLESQRLRSIMQKKRLENRPDTKKYKNSHGLVSKKCKQCKKYYDVYASHIKHRGSNFCSFQCKKENKKSTVKYRQNVIWQLCRTITRIRYGNTCYTCGQEELVGGNFQTGHFIARSICGVYLKYDLRNLRPQCYRCNINAGGAGAIFYKLMVEREGQAYVDEIFEDKKKEVHMKYQDWIDLEQNLRKRLMELE